MNNLEMKDFVNFIIELFNIKSGTRITIMDITNEMMKLSNPLEFVNFAKQNIDSPKYNYQTGYQKFTLVKRDFDDMQINKIDSNTTEQLNIFINTTFQQVTRVMDEVSWTLESKGKTIDEVDASKTFIPHFVPKQLEILSEIGDWKELLRLCKYAKQSLEFKITSIVFRKALIKINPNIAIKKPKNHDKLMIENLRRRIS